MKLKIVAISDMHGHFPVIKEPTDIMLIAGDTVPLEIQFNKEFSKQWFETTFASWIKSLPIEKVYMIAGNHDFYFQGISQANLAEFKHATDYKVIYLKNKHVEHVLDDGTKVTIFGTPYCTMFGTWPFMREDDYLKKAFEQIPDKCDIIIAHNPPFAWNKSDMILESPRNRYIDEHCGSKPLTERLKEIDFKLLVCGHIHSGDHNLVDKVVNVSIVNEQYKLAYEPFYTELEFDENNLSNKESIDG